MIGVILAFIPIAAGAAAGDGMKASTCAEMRSAYKEASCCGAPAKASGFQVVPVPEHGLFSNNICAGKKPDFPNIDCIKENVVAALEQAGANVTKGYQGDMDVGERKPITTSYLAAGLCPVNVHWHLGAEHYSHGEFDHDGKGPDHGRRLATDARLGFRCHHYDASDPKFTTPYHWKHCVGMHVGETYEIHWPHSAAGACGTPYQFQTPFYDGVFCNSEAVEYVLGLDKVSGATPFYNFVGVQAQVFTIVNDEHYYYPDLMRGRIHDGQNFGEDIAKYTGSTTGTSRNNEVCSQYTPITWQVDRKCHMISASSFDKMCADMKSQVDDMSGDLHAHGARELVADNIAANNQEGKK